MYLLMISVLPFVCGWFAVDSFCLIPVSLQSSSKKFSYKLRTSIRRDCLRGAKDSPDVRVEKAGHILCGGGFEARDRYRPSTQPADGDEEVIIATTVGGEGGEISRDMLPTDGAVSATAVGDPGPCR